MGNHENKDGIAGGILRGSPYNEVMGRQISAKTCQSLIDDWRDSLVPLKSVFVGSPSDVRRLAVAIGLDGPEIALHRRRKMKKAVNTLGPALSSLDADGEQSARPDALDGWIERFLLKRGRESLIPADVWQVRLARQRDARRRASHSESGLHSARVEMPMANWEKLRAIVSHLEKKAVARDGFETKITRGIALAQVIDAYQIGAPIARTRKALRRGAEAASRQADIFEPLSVSEASRKAQ